MSYIESTGPVTGVEPASHLILRPGTCVNVSCERGARNRIGCFAFFADDIDEFLSVTKSA